MLKKKIIGENRNKCFQFVSLLIFIVVLYIHSIIEGDTTKGYNEYENIVNQLENSYKKKEHNFIVNIKIDDNESLLKEIDQFEIYCYGLNDTSQPNVTFQKIREEMVDCIEDGGGGKS